jgi:hypothetical protein
MIRSYLIAIVFSLLSLPLSARAQDACKADAEKLCKDVRTGGGRIIACLKSHKSELPPACQEKLAVGKAKGEKVHEGCQPDVDRFCKGIKPGEGRIIACLKSHEAELAPACKAVVAR